MYLVDLEIEEVTYADSSLAMSSGFEPHCLVLLLPAAQFGPVKAFQGKYSVLGGQVEPICSWERKLMTSPTLQKGLEKEGCGADR